MRRLGPVSWLLAGVLAGSVAFVGLLPAAPSAQSATATPYTSTPERIAYDQAGDATTIERLKVGLTVSSTTNLRGLQQIDVSWTGAHPTGGIATDPNSGSASRQEYPMVLLQCRGTGAAITPQTCWTSTAEERYQRSNPESFAWPAWRSDAAASAAERGQFVGRPASNPKGCELATFGAERWVPFVAKDKSSYPGGAAGCGGVAPEASAFGDVGMPSNTTYGVTQADGTGSARFSVWTNDENASLGCSTTVACSLVAVPIVGLSCDAWGTRLPATAPRPTGTSATRADGYCRGTDQYEPGDLSRPGVYNLSTSGQLWWAASNWRSRIVVPLTFALSSNICGVVNKTAPISVFGSILFNELSAQWMPKFCTTKGYRPFVHVQTADTAARNLIVAGSAAMSLSSRAPEEPYGRPVVQAPVALTGFAIGFNIDKADGSRLRNLKLNARLVAKLLSQSYPATSGVRSSYPALSGNPLNVTRDPEFQALNPDAPQLGAVEAAATILALNTDSDLMWALTSWMDQDPEARAFLDGEADPWGMKVNPNYVKVKLPIGSWTLLDQFELSNDTVCYNASPSPYLGLVANPLGQLNVLLQDVQYAISNVATSCSSDADASDPTTLRLRVQGRQIPGHRFVLGIVPLTAAHRYGFDVAQLQTASSVPLDDTFDSADGRQFVAGNDAGLKAGAALLAADPTAGLWTFPYASLRTAAGAKAYPGTMPVFATVPTQGLSSDVASRVAQVLTYAAGPGQVKGSGTGQLPPGALPLTATDGLAALAAYTRCAARAVTAQAGDVPAVDATTCSVKLTPSTTPATTSPATPVAPAGPVVGDLAPVAVPAAVVPDRAPVTATDTPVLVTAAVTSGFGRYGLPGAAFALVFLLVFGIGLRWGDRFVPALTGLVARVRRAA